MVNRHSLRLVFQDEGLTIEQLEQSNLVVRHAIPTYRTPGLTNEELSEPEKRAIHIMGDWSNITIVPTQPTHRIAPSDSSLPQPQHLIGTAPPYTLMQAGHEHDAQGQVALHTNTYDADRIPSPNGPCASTTAIQSTANPAELSEEEALREWKQRMARSKDPAEEAADDERIMELRNATSNGVRLVSSCSNLRTHFKVDGELSVDAARDRMREPFSKTYCHGFDRHDSYGRSRNLPRPKTMTVTNSKADEKKVVSMDRFTFLTPLTKEEQSFETGRDDIWTQIARGRK